MLVVAFIIPDSSMEGLASGGSSGLIACLGRLSEVFSEDE